ncbi:ParM/StbA family protein [Bacillus velezensis]|uniref:ParM/StbA family protein n=1 Tax=Bacillus velezensis TaxID=492670 RepID=UPI002AF761EA|nr:ParM/StbA family protein [Bacillus velezensis]MDH3104069.1 ParM/StbA family protein [Bacillus velezensis]MDH3139027.1 ParM/StbA family protein [Bacillus velezensis]HEO2443910.1 ParM/StbA family protein [Streptococcus agalactiae]
MTTLKVGADAGNDSLKLWVAGEEPVSVPMVYAYYPGETMDLLDEQDIDIEPDKLFDNLDVTINSPSLSVNNGDRVIIGRKVLTDHLPSIELEENSDKSSDEIPLFVTIASLAAVAMRKNPSKNKLRVKYDLGISLPVNSISKKSARRNEDRYIGTHEVTFHHPSNRKVHVTVIIEFAKCQPEGAAGAWGVVYNENGELQKRTIEVTEGKIAEIDFQHQEMLHFDIGAGTSELVVTKGVVFNPRLSEGLNYGVRKTINNIRKVWNHKYSLKAIDTLAEFNQIYFNSEHPRHSTLRNFSKPYLKSLADQLSREIINKIDFMKDNPYVFIYGGGSLIIKDYLEQILEAKKRDYNVTFLSNPTFVNARGLLVYASSPRFNQLKKSALDEVKETVESGE